MYKWIAAERYSYQNPSLHLFQNRPWHFCTWDEDWNWSFRPSEGVHWFPKKSLLWLPKKLKNVNKKLKNVNKQLKNVNKPNAKEVVADNDEKTKFSSLCSGSSNVALNISKPRLLLIPTKFLWALFSCCVASNPWGPIIYFIEGRSLSRHKWRFCIYRVP